MKTIKLPLDLYDVPPGTKIYNEDKTQAWILMLRQLPAKLVHVQPDAFHVVEIPLLVKTPTNSVSYIFPDSALQANGGTLYYEEEA